MAVTLPPTPPPHFWGGNRDPPTHPPPYRGWNRRIPPLKAPQVLGSDRGSPAPGLGAQQGKGGRPPPLQPQPTPDPSCGLQILMEELEGALGREGRLPPAQPPPQNPGERVLLVKTPPALGVSTIPAGRASPGRGPGGGGRQNAAPPPRAYDIFQMVSEAVRTPAAKMVMVCQVGVPKWDKSPSCGEGTRHGGSQTFPYNNRTQGSWGTADRERGFGVKGDVGEGKFPKRSSAPRGMAGSGAQGGVREGSGIDPPKE